MKKEKPKVQSVLETVFVDAVSRLQAANAGRFIGELHVQLDLSIGEIQIYDDQEALLGKNIIFEWAEHSENGVHSHKQAVHLIRVALAGLKSQKFFELTAFMQPFTVSLVDENFNKIETIFLLDDVDTFVHEGRLMKNLEQELQNFSKKLFADV
jgi:hypothetical protein